MHHNCKYKKDTMLLTYIKFMENYTEEHNRFITLTSGPWRQLRIRNLQFMYQALTTVTDKQEHS